VFLLHLLTPWTWKMAWRDSRRGRQRLLLFSMSIMLGIAALVAIGSLKENLVEAVENQAKALVGSDVFINARRGFNPAADELLNKSGAIVAREVSHLSALSFPTGKADSGLLRVEARAVAAEFPFYGTPVTEPADAWARCMKGEGFVCDPLLLEQAGVSVGATVKLGALESRILGVFITAPARASWAGAFGMISPEVFYARDLEAKTKLSGGLFTFHRAHLKFPSGKDPEDWARKVRDQFKREGADLETVEKRRKNIGQVLDHLYSFLSLLGFVALVLGGLGVASAIHVHVQQRLSSVATLRCLGGTSSQAFAVFVAQGIALGFCGAIGGVLIGIALQRGMPLLFKSYIPIEIDIAFQPQSILVALGLGFLICVSFAILPLLKIRRISPLAAVRAAYTEELPPPRRWLRWVWLVWIIVLGFWTWQAWRGHIGWMENVHTRNVGFVVLFLIGAGLMVRAVDPIWWVIIGLLGGTLTFLAYQLSPPKNPAVGYGFAVLLGLGLLVLVLIAKLVIKLASVLRHPLWPYPLRQGMLNLHRPRNQTLLFLLSAGLGVTLILTMILMQHLLLQFLESKTLRDKPNLILLDVKMDQEQPLRKILSPLTDKPLEYSTMVNMQLTQLNGKTLVDLQKKPETRMENWILGYRFNSTTRAALTRSEKLLSGQMPTRYDGTGPVPITVDKGLIEKLHAKLGDVVTFAIEEETMECRLVGTREIEWQELGINFFFVFPPGALEKFPHTGVMTARVTDPGQSAAAQKQIAGKFSNLNMIDIGQIFATVTGIIDKVAFVIRFMALFTIGTGIIILVAVLVGGKRDRVEESVLLRTLGASRAQIWKILVSEYALLGFLASLIGSGLALGATWWLAKYAFKLENSLWLTPCLWAVVALTSATTIIGLLLSRGITSTPPLAILRGGD
jgi:putative ABC transport system permease protein